MTKVQRHKLHPLHHSSPQSSNLLHQGEPNFSHNFQIALFGVLFFQNNILSSQNAHLQNHLHLHRDGSDFSGSGSSVAWSHRQKNLCGPDRFFNETNNKLARGDPFLHLLYNRSHNLLHTARR